jgi:hypothetical protein
MIGIVDTSFIMDWLRYEKNNLVFKLFGLLHLPESVLTEVKSERALLRISEGIKGQ